MCFPSCLSLIWVELHLHSFSLACCLLQNLALRGEFSLCFSLGCQFVLALDVALVAIVGGCLVLMGLYLMVALIYAVEAPLAIGNCIGVPIEA